MPQQMHSANNTTKNNNNTTIFSEETERVINQTVNWILDKEYTNGSLTPLIVHGYVSIFAFYPDSARFPSFIFFFFSCFSLFIRSALFFLSSAGPVEAEPMSDVFAKAFAALTDIFLFADAYLINCVFGALRRYPINHAQRE